MITRRNNAIKILMKKIEKDNKQKEKEEKNQRKLKDGTSNSKQAGRPILQMNDELNIIARFESVAEASRQVEISPKSIRDAAKGVQKHAGGYVWRYEDPCCKGKKPLNIRRKI